MEGKQEGHKHCLQGELGRGVPGEMAELITVNTKGESRARVDRLARAALRGCLHSDGPWDVHSGVCDVSSLCFLWLSGIQLHIHKTPQLKASPATTAGASVNRGSGMPPRVGTI